MAPSLVYRYLFDRGSFYKPGPLTGCRDTVRILYLADIRFPLERANGIQSMETCHALAARGHEVTLVVRPDSHTPARDPFAFYGLPARSARALRSRSRRITGPAAARRVGYVTFAIGRAMGRTRQDLIFTRDLGLASLLLRLPAAMRAPVVYEAHGIAADVAAALPGLLTRRRRHRRPSCAAWRGGRRTSGSAADYVTITDGLSGTGAPLRTAVSICRRAGRRSIGGSSGRIPQWHPSAAARSSARNPCGRWPGTTSA